MNIKRRCQFVLEKRKNPDGSLKPDAPIKLRVKYDGKIVDFSAGYRVDVSKWNLDSQRCNANTTNRQKQSASEINNELQRLEDLLTSVFKAWEVKEIIPTVEQLRESVDAANKKTGSVYIGKKPIFDYFDMFVSEQSKKNNWTAATCKKFAAVRNHLVEFDSALTFDRLTEDKLLAYVQFLREGKSFRNSTIGKQLGFLKWFLRWASSKGYNTNMVYVSFAPKLKTSERKVIFLDWEELMAVYTFSIPPSKQYLERVRDVFCFCCFTSLRYSDAYNLKKSDIFDDYIAITTIKTADSLQIDLNKWSRAILDKYKDVHFKDGKALPVISNQKMNDYIKELGKLCGIDQPITEIYYVGNERREETYPKYELLSTHTGRRTFICNALAMGIPPQVVMKWTGHSDYQAMKPYIEVADSIRKSEMDKFNQK